MVTTVSLLRKESGRLLEDQEEVMRISQESARDIPEERNKIRGRGLGQIRYSAKIRDHNIWKRVSMKDPARELRENT